MTVVTDYNIKVSSSCKRPTELLLKNGPIGNGAAINHDLVLANAMDPIESSVPSQNLGLIIRLMPKHLHPRIERILYWRDVRKTSLIFMGGLMLFAAISYYSLISVLSHLSLALLTSIFILKIFSRVFGKSYLITNWPKCDNLDAIVLKIVNYMLYIAADLRDIIFVKDLYRTLKICFILHIWTFIGELMNGYTLLVGTYVALFLIPKACELIWQKLLKMAEKGIQYCKSKNPFWELDD